MTHPFILRQVRKDRFERNQAIPFAQYSDQHLTAANLLQAQLSCAPRLLFCHTPAQFHLLQVEAVRRSAAAQLWEDGVHQHISLSVHVSKGGGDKHADDSPPDERDVEKEEGDTSNLTRQTVGRQIFKSNDGKNYLNSGTAGIGTTLLIT